ncbi:hypothetical protein HMPREF1531_00321 [Propionibacterium sp. oral taxon 192 str. F0372]|uniref:hypothetical protein n=1 Tax=Propionibacterium sp. oral taxon 192 TaxID=671222 RepID=UPI0003535F7B|nr:hypothetical protein [Propionibacterium sp. oral taxon 192]EPH07263.1 hypothetical protein HMPREF1531_00321 [Propionibacterium sp. oral taxon 192 str. F0372]
MPSFSVDIDALRDARDGVYATMNSMKTRSVEDMAPSSGDVGHDDLAAAVKDFCDRWQIGVENLEKTTDEVASRLDFSYRAYAATEEVNELAAGQLLTGSSDPAA